MKWFGKKQQPPATLDSDRYRGKPLLILLENYVLDCIGALPEEKSSMVATMVQRVYGGDGDWKATLRATLHLDESLDEHLRQMWAQNQEIARQNHQHLSPEDFARMVVDQNFASMIG